MFRRLSLLKPFLTKPPNVRSFRSEAPKGPHAVRFRHRRNSNNPSQVRLDKFIKHVKMDGSLVVKAPFSLKVKGSYFDANHNVDRERNRQMLSMLRGYGGTTSKTDRFDGSLSMKPKKLKEVDPSLREDVLSLENEILDSLVRNLSQDFIRQLNDDANLLKQSNRDGHVDKSDEENASDDKSVDSGVREGSERRLDEKSPLHVLFYGRSNHRLDSYSVLNSNNQHQTYVYIMESSFFDETDSMLMQFDPAATVSIWQPKTTKSGMNNLLEDVMVAGFKIFCPYHLLDVQDSDIKAVFLVPVSLGKLYLQADRDGHLEVDGTLLEDLLSVGLYTEIGNIKVRDIEAVEIKLASRMGDIFSDGILDGHIVGETFGDGDFLARSVEGPNVAVSTEDGDIHVWHDCRSETSKFSSRRGSIHVRNVFGSSTMEIAESGNITTNIVSGSLNAYVERGGIFAGIETLTQDSLLRVEKGEIHINVPQKCNFRIQASGSRTNISPRLLNSGEIYLSDQTGHESFVTHPLRTNGDTSQPTLTVVANNGSVNIVMLQSEEEKSVEKGFDSV